MIEDAHITDCMQIKLTGSRYGTVPVIRESDKKDLVTVAIAHQFDYIVIPCVQTGRDIQEVRQFLGKDGEKLHIIAKIDTVQGVQNFATIIKAADGVVILRNELAYELEPEKLILA